MGMQRWTGFSPPHGAQRQRGGILIFTALGMGLVLACLMVLDIGNLIWQKREIQKIADLAAVAGAQNPLNQSCVALTAGTVHRMAVANGLRPGSHDTLVVQMGEWDPGKYAQQATKFQATQDMAVANACAVTVQRRVDVLFVFDTQLTSRTISAQAVAYTKPPLAAVAIRSSVAGLQGGILNSLLNNLLGGGVGATLISWNGLASAQVNLLQVFDRMLLNLNLQAGNYQQLLDADLTVADLVRAMVDVLQPQNAATAAVSALNALLGLNLKTIDLSLGDLLSLDNLSHTNALNLNLNALDLISGSLQLASQNQAVNLGLSLPSGSVTAKLKIIEPPQFSISGTPKPYDPNAQLRIRTAQVRLWLAVTPSASALTNAVTKAVDALIDVVEFLLGVVTLGAAQINLVTLNTLNIDILLELGGGQVEVGEVHCDGAEKSLDVRVSREVGMVKVGSLGASLAAREAAAFAKHPAPATPLNVLTVDGRTCPLLAPCTTEPEKYGAIKLGGDFSLLGSHKDVQYADGQINDLSVVVGDGTTPAAPAQFHTVTFPALAGLENALDVTKLIQIKTLSGVDLVSGIRNLLNLVVQPLLQGVGTLLSGILATLGIGLNTIEVAPFLQCGRSGELVY